MHHTPAWTTIDSNSGSRRKRGISLRYRQTSSFTDISSCSWRERHASTIEGVFFHMIKRGINLTIRIQCSDVRKGAGGHSEPECCAHRRIFCSWFPDTAVAPSDDARRITPGKGSTARQKCPILPRFETRADGGVDEGNLIHVTDDAAKH